MQDETFRQFIIRFRTTNTEVKDPNNVTAFEAFKDCLRNKMTKSLLSSIGITNLNEAFTNALVMAESDEISESQTTKNDHPRK